VEGLQSREAELHEQIRTHEEQLGEARASFEQVTEVAAKARVEVETASGNVNAIQREHENLSRIVVSLGSRATQLQQEIENLVRRQGDTGVAVENARTQLEQSLAKLHEVSETRISLEAEAADLTARVQELEARALASRDTWNTAKNSLFESERRVDRAKSGFDLLREQISLDLHAGIDALADAEPPADDEARTTLESEVAKLSDQLEKIGPVNVLAIDEHQELETRESFLRTQRDDLVQSIEALRQTIRKINLTSRELFREAFNQVNESFTIIFTSLFGGGTALDEVDAPLDEVNTERFVRLVRDMSRDTQFIVITHSRRTMEAADVLYGVTMEEAGCSRLVSVNFSEFE
jgi:chromosome segregation protein